MIKHLFSTLVLLTIICTGVFGQSRAIVDFEADVMKPTKVGDSTVFTLVGNVVFHHNGAVITCDSAIRYSDRMMECFNNVIVNKDSTYVYGERADYNGTTNIANIYSLMVKLIDKDVTMYSYDLSFNTLTNVGQYSNSGTISQKDNLMESRKASYHSKTREVFFEEYVSMKNDDYQIKTDSMGYNFDAEVTTFYKKANIWSKDGDFLSAKRGKYVRPTDTYIFTNDSYVLTADQQMWADSITYIKSDSVAYLYRNIQLQDEKERILGFGDYGIYRGKDGNALLTKNPALAGYEATEGSDTVYMRADSIFMFTMPIDVKADSTTAGEEQIIPTSTTHNETASTEENKDAEAEHDDHEGHDHTLSKQAIRDAKRDERDKEFERRMAEKEAKRLAAKEKKQKKGEKQSSDSTSVVKEIESLADSLAITAIAKADSLLKTLPEEQQRQVTGAITAAGKIVAENPEMVSGIVEAGKQILSNAVKGATTDSLLTATAVAAPLNSSDSTAMARLEIPTEQKPDTMQRVFRGYFNVKIFRNDFQGVCDSIVGFSADSTVHMYDNPILWNEDNQIVADVIHGYIKNGQLYKAEMEGSPMMSQKIDNISYNQVAGKIMYAYFKDNTISKLDVDGNAQTFYYLQDEKTKDLTGFLVAESANITFTFDSSRVENITYRVDPVYTIYPMDKIPATQARTLQGFEWKANERPTKADVFDRTIRPSQRTESMEIPKPDFGITTTIGIYKTNLIRQNMWRERNEKPWINASYFRQATQ